MVTLHDKLQCWFLNDAAKPEVIEKRICGGTDHLKGSAVTQWLRCCATNRKFAGSIPDGVIGIFH